jgi:RNA polymerase sigma-70 factor (ECF subfamily)
MQADREFASFRGTTEEELLAWLRTMMAHTAANLVRHYYRSQKRAIALEESLLEEFDRSAERVRHAPVAAGSSPSQQATRREEVVRLAEAIERLPEEYREAIILRHLKGMSMQEVAVEMNRTVDSARKLWARALVLLRKDLS